MADFTKVISAMFAYGGFAAAILGFLTAAAWRFLAHPGSRASMIAWMVGAVLNLPLLFLLIRVLAGSELFGAPFWQQLLLFAVMFWGVGGLGIGWLAGLLVGQIIRAFNEAETARQA